MKMHPIRIYEPAPINGRLSFNGKCKIVEYGTGTRYLFSYDTLVMIFKRHEYKRTWSGYSATTLSHVSAFMGRKVTKKEWLAMPIYKEG